MLELQDLTRRFGGRAAGDGGGRAAVDGVTLAIPDGQMVGIIGRSGAGKSTLLRMVNRLTEPTSGRILHHGTDVTTLRGRALRDWRTRCAMIFQGFNLIQRLDVLTNVLVGRLNHRHGALAALNSLLLRFTPEERAMALDALDRFDLAEQALQRADTLSGGQQQRVAIARAMLQEPRILLADEPIASLDPRNARVVMEALRDVNRRDGLTVLVNLHHLDTARRYCDRIIAMAAGRVVFDGPPSVLTGGEVEAIYGVPEEALEAETPHAPAAA
ncbi:phosphonate ABC transporter ATP-binding protein [Muricoccus pecuniae]|uniref:Phosphonate transport system ATP-binding protein n=1 Tax=Muricoccus pecuniae TaxID=693023 RepID=A0A840XTQ3_9PROT|nr:phosphonate ABC transporter ATP-binding protein [Roseomonas pecuniae]MBB5692078.1 phosphonate transport system ATP-binding protein [Roseomonas pecuniae]